MVWGVKLLTQPRRHYIQSVLEIRYQLSFIYRDFLSRAHYWHSHSTNKLSHNSIRLPSLSIIGKPVSFCSIHNNGTKFSLVHTIFQHWTWHPYTLRLPLSMEPDFVANHYAFGLSFGRDLVNYVNASVAARTIFSCILSRANRFQGCPSELFMNSYTQFVCQSNICDVHHKSAINLIFRFLFYYPVPPPPTQWRDFR